MEQDDQAPERAKLFVAVLIVVGVGLTGMSMVKRVHAVGDYPRIVVDLIQQSCDTSAFANPLTNVRGESSKMVDRPC